MQTVSLNNGVKMPILGFGVFQIPDQSQCERSVLDALEAGYRHIDTAAAYGNEEAVGKAIKKSGIPRKEIFVTTKLWISDTNYEKAKKAFALSLEKLGLDYLDLYLIHQPYNDVYGAWRAMEELCQGGAIKAIGVSNFIEGRLLDLILNNKIVPAVNQIELHPFFQRVENHNFMKGQNVQIEGWGPFAEGKNDIFNNKTLIGIGKKYGKSPAQIIIRWHIERGIVVIPKSVHKERIIQNFSVWDFTLDADDMKAIAALDTNQTLFFDHSTPEVTQFLHSRA